MSTSVINAVFNHFKFFDKLNHFNLTRELAHMTHKKWDKNVTFFLDKHIDVDCRTMSSHTNMLTQEKKQNLILINFINYNIRLKITYN